MGTTIAQRLAHLEARQEASRQAGQEHRARLLAAMPVDVDLVMLEAEGKPL